MKLKFVVYGGIILLFSGCFRVGRMPITTTSGPHYDNPQSAILVPKGSQTRILSVNNEVADAEALDKLANLTLFPFLMYLEPQVSLKPGPNEIGVRALDESTTDYGSYSVTTTKWRDYTITVDAKVGQRYIVVADLSSGAEIRADTEDKKLASK